MIPKFCSTVVLGLAAQIFASNEGGPIMVMGPEGSDPATTGYNLNHVSLNVRDLTRSLKFYTEVFGMRQMFTVNLTDHYSITYLAHSSGGKNGTGYQTTPELIRNQHNSQGLLALLYLDVPDNTIPSSTEMSNTLMQVGFVVPDIHIAQDRLEELGVTFYKKISEPFPRDGPLHSAGAFDPTKISPEEFETLIAVMTTLNENTIFAADPDGNVLEILGQETAAVVPA
jgi:lactoylglutathione lyase